MYTGFRTSRPTFKLPSPFPRVWAEPAAKHIVIHFVVKGYQPFNSLYECLRFNLTLKKKVMAR